MASEKTLEHYQAEPEGYLDLNGAEIGMAVQEIRTLCWECWTIISI